MQMRCAKKGEERCATLTVTITTIRWHSKMIRCVYTVDGGAGLCSPVQKLAVEPFKSHHLKACMNTFSSQYNRFFYWLQWAVTAVEATVCACVCERERKRERNGLVSMTSLIQWPWFYPAIIPFKLLQISATSLVSMFMFFRHESCFCEQLPGKKLLSIL